MNNRTVLDWEQARRYRRTALGLAPLAALVGGAIVLVSQEVSDFLREGPVRITDLRGDSLQFVLGLGSISAGLLAVAALWPRGGPLPVLVGSMALAVGIFLTHAIFFPVVGLFLAAVVIDLAAATPRERLEQLGPRRYPLLWALAGAGALAGAVGVVWLSVWLIQPLFDEGETLNEALAFNVEGVQQPTTPTLAAEQSEQEPDPAAAEEQAAAPAATEEAETAPPATEGTLISSGPLMGVDAFHTGSGDVLLIQAPDGSLILRFQDYAVRNGPDLHVYLTPDPGGDVHVDGALDLGKIKATQGFVNYDVPSGVDPATFRAAVIYCVPFSVTFATAELAGG